MLSTTTLHYTAMHYTALHRTATSCPHPHPPKEFARNGFAITQSAPASRKAATSSSKAFPVMPMISRVNP